MPKMITVESTIKDCPVCGAPLKYAKPHEDTLTTCTSCEYQEPPGSLHYVSFLSAVLREYAKGSKLFDCNIHGHKKPISMGFSPVVFAPLLVDRANALTQGNQDAKAILGAGGLFATVNDSNAYFGKRVVYVGNDSAATTDKMFDLVKQITSITFAVRETVELSKLRLHTPQINTFYPSDVQYFGQLIAPPLKLQQSQSVIPNNSVGPKS